MMGAGILMSIIKTLVLLAKRLIFGCSGFLAPAWFSGGGLCKAGRIPFFGIHECCIFAVCYSGVEVRWGFMGLGESSPSY